MVKTRSRPDGARARVASATGVIARRLSRRGRGGAGRWESVVPMPPGAILPEKYREAMSAFPTPVSVVTALDDSGQPRGLTCSAVASVTVEPPTLLVCVNRRNHSLQAIRGSGGFVVNLLREGSDRVSQVFASGTDDKFSSVPWRPSPGSGLPWLHEDALVYVDCELVAECEVGSHAVLIGLARDSHTAADVGDEHAGGGALVYWRRAYGRWTGLDTAPVTPLRSARPSEPLPAAEQRA